MKRWSLVTITLAAFLAFGLGDIALAKQGRGRGRGRGGDRDAVTRVRERVGLAVVDTTDVAPRKARLRIRRKSASRIEMRVQLDDANPGFDLDIWFQDGAGVMSRVGALRESRDGRRDADYSWRVRTRKGEALPFGVSDVSDLSGRDFEVRNGSSVVVRGTVPNVAAARAAGGKRALARSPLSSTAAGDGGSGDTSADSSVEAVKAEIRLRRKRGNEQFKVEVEHLDAGLALAAWIEDADGVMQWVGDLVEDTSGEYELEIESEDGPLPLGVDSLSELAGRGIEVRDAAGDVIVSGFLPTLGAESATDDDDGDDSVDDATDDDDGDDSADDATDDDDDDGDDSADDSTDDDGGDDDDDDDSADDD